MTSTRTTPDLTPYRPGPRAWGALVVAELRSVSRDTAGLVVPLGLPALILVMYGLGGADAPGSGGDGLSVLEAQGIPLAITMVLAMIGAVNMPSFLAMYRRGGVLRRLGVTPLNPMAVLVAQVAASAVQSLLGIGIALGIAATVFGASAPRSVAAALVGATLVAAAMYGVGMVVAAVSPTPNSAVAIGLVAFFAMGAAGGMFGPVEVLPDELARIGSWLPFAAGIEVLSSAWAGSWASLRDVLVLVGCAAAGVAGSLLTFRWDR